MHVYVATGVVTLIALSILASVAFGVQLTTLSMWMKAGFGLLLVASLIVHHRRSKRDELRQAQTNQQIEHFRNMRH